MLDRREFFRRLMATTAGVVLAEHLSTAATGAPATGTGAPATDAPPREDRFGKRLPQRRLGNTGQWVTMLGLGGSHILYGNDDAASGRLIDLAIERGIRFFDTAQQYGNGESERRYGRHLTPKYREVAYIMTKTQAKDAERARRDVEECRKRLDVDVLDLMQMHALSSAGDSDRRIDQGVLDVLLEAREQGKIRHIGFTGHSTPAAHLRMLERLDEMGVQLDTMQMPINVVDPSYESFVLRVVPKAVEKGYGVLAMKTLAYGQIMGENNGWGGRPRRAPQIIPNHMSLAQALGFVWSLPVSTLISGMSKPDMLRENTQLAREHADLNEAQRQELVDAAAEFAGPATEFYKREV